MGSLSNKKPHAVFIPYPAQGHINPMLMLAKLLHGRGFHITFVLTEYNYNRLARSQGPAAVKGLADFCFVPALCDSTTKNFLAPFRRFIAKLNDYPSPVSCIVSDGTMTFTLDAARELGIPEIMLWTASACGFLSYIHYQQLIVVVSFL